MELTATLELLQIEYAGGVYRRFRAYYDNGQLIYEQRYVDGEIDGPEIGWHRDGTKAYEGRHAAGKSVGKWARTPNKRLSSGSRRAFRTASLQAAQHAPRREDARGLGRRLEQRHHPETRLIGCSASTAQ